MEVCPNIGGEGDTLSLRVRWVDFDLGVPSCCSAALPDFYLLEQNQSYNGTTKTKSTQPSLKPAVSPCSIRTHFMRDDQMSCIHLGCAGRKKKTFSLHVSVLELHQILNFSITILVLFTCMYYVLDHARSKFYIFLLVFIINGDLDS